MKHKMPVKNKSINAHKNVIPEGERTLVVGVADRQA
jgi:hypothetical protein